MKAKQINAPTVAEYDITLDDTEARIVYAVLGQMTSDYSEMVSDHSDGVLEIDEIERVTDRLYKQMGELFDVSS